MTDPTRKLFDQIAFDVISADLATRMMDELEQLDPNNPRSTAQGWQQQRVRHRPPNPPSEPVA